MFYFVILVMLTLHKPIKLNSTRGIKDVRKTIQTIFQYMPITDVAYLVALKDIAGDLDIVAGELRKRLKDNVTKDDLQFR